MFWWLQEAPLVVNLQALATTIGAFIFVGMWSKQAACFGTSILLCVFH
jgi:hypothetical protein